MVCSIIVPTSHKNYSSTTILFCSNFDRWPMMRTVNLFPARTFVEQKQITSWFVDTFYGFHLCFVVERREKQNWYWMYIYIYMCIHVSLQFNAILQHSQLLTCQKFPRGKHIPDFFVASTRGETPTWFPSNKSQPKRATHPHPHPTNPVRSLTFFKSTTTTPLIKKCRFQVSDIWGKPN